MREVHQAIRQWSLNQSSATLGVTGAGSAYGGVAMGASNRGPIAALTRVGLVGAVTGFGMIVAAVSAGAALSGTPGYLAGYAVTVPNSNTVQETTQVQFTVPAITCDSSTDRETVYEGIRFGSDPQGYSLIWETCHAGSSSYYGQLASGNNETVSSLTISPGDKVELHAKWNPAVHFDMETMLINDLTTGQSQSLGSGTTKVGGPSTVTIGLTDQNVLPNFGLIQWDGALVNGQALGNAGPQQSYLVHILPNGRQKLLASASSLSASGESFRTDWVRGS
jgi:hypothetical protein